MRNKFSRVSDPNEFRTHSGDKFHRSYDSIFQSDGTIRLKEAGKSDIQAEINSHLMETDMAVIISKLQMGDTSGLTSKKPMYGDFTNLPKSYAEAYDMVTRSEKVFESLSPDIKQRFDNDRAQWFSTIGTPEWIDKMALVVPDAKESEVTE